MNIKASSNWKEANWHYLFAAIAVVRQALKEQVACLQNHLTPSTSSDQGGETRDEVQSALEAATAAMPAPSALEELCTTFGLSLFERDILLLCAGMELDAAFPVLCGDAQGDMQRSYPTFSLAINVLPEPEWSAFTPNRPLRRWRLIEVGAGQTLTSSPLRIDEWVLHYLTGMQPLDERVMGIIKPVSAGGELVPSHRQLAEQIAAIWSQGKDLSALPIVQLYGDDMASKQAITFAACAMSGIQHCAMPAQAVPTQASELNSLMLLWERESLLSTSALLLDCDEMDGMDAARESAIAQWIESVNSRLIVTSRERQRVRQRPAIAFEVYQPTKNEQRILWQTALGTAASELNGQVEVLVSQFNLNAPRIHAVCAEVRSVVSSQEEQCTTDNGQRTTLLWDTCLAQARPRLDDLAQRIEPAASWDDLVLPEKELQTLRGVAAHVRQRLKVYENWGFANKGGRGLGISALFAGVSGTGKTMSAEVLAQELRLDLYRIDLSAVVSKYIGETEKNLRRVFDAAEGGATILLFDEADALFGKRSDVKDSHDRYANMEVSYLLQRMEAYQGLAILTTNLKDTLDTAFLRRIRFVVKFPFPDATQRAEIWRRIFPKQTPTEGLDAARLAKLNVAGGNIRNIALNAAFLAADAEEPVRMKHLLDAARSEYVKLERTLTDVEVKGWV